jgi:hypothetical protein
MRWRARSRRLDGEWRSELERFAQSLVDARLVPGRGIAVAQGDQRSLE